MNTKDKQKATAIINRMEKMKKENYASHELRGSNQMMRRLDRVQNKDFSKKISMAQERLKDKAFIDDLYYDNNMEDREVLEMFGIKKRNVKNKRGGVWNF